jgi:hypothetical protein
VILYNRRAETLILSGHTDLALATAENVRQAVEQLQALAAEGGTDHLSALKQAVLLHPDVIFFLTDADDMKAEDVRALTRLNGGHAAIHTIELTLAHRDRDEMPMHQLANGNRGKYLAVDINQMN